MGWSSGSAIMSEIISALKEVGISKEDKVEIYERLIQVFEDFDCDTLDECLTEDPAFKLAYNQLYPDYLSFEDDEVDEWDDQDNNRF